MKRVMASSNDDNDHNNEDDRDNNDNNDYSSNEYNNANNDNDNDEDSGNEDEVKVGVAAAAVGFVHSGSISGGDCGGVGGGGFGGWRVVVVVGLVVVDGRGGACSRCEPSARCLKRLMGSQAMVNDAMDVQGKAGWGYWRQRLFLFLCLWVVCLDSFQL
jgi:hypothetical protein